MNVIKCKEILHWMINELRTLSHGEIHIVLKVRDRRVSLIEKTKIIKEKPE
jgi:hypothetical protein